jgi:hypothetical protein
MEDLLKTAWTANQYYELSQLAVRIRRLVREWAMLTRVGQQRSSDER